MLSCLVCVACAVLPSSANLTRDADQLAARSGWVPVRLPVEPFELAAYLPAQPHPAPTLTIYIEGDGFAWLSATQPSADPTPHDPLALRLALAQPAGNAAYIARPCQYVDAVASHCERRYWTDARFAEPVIAATSRAVDALKARFGAKRVMLVGYSGGAAVALLVAARRSDVAGVVTVAGNVDHRAWARYHRVSALAESLDPVDDIDALSNVAQWHFAGGRDDNIPPFIARAFADRFAEDRRPLVRVEPSFDHRCCWVDTWPALWRTVTDGAP
jgi:dienelactone hydrolase